MNQLETSLLNSIKSPDDLKLLNVDELPQLASELRAFIIESVSKTGGHLSAGLGSVELTIALHYLYDTPEDHLVWDVGHQSYPHKILTGRKDKMQTLRTTGGISGFPKRTESPFDAFGVGHSSTSISAALGLAIADQAHGKNNHAIAIIGDGGMSGGMAFEAMNHAGSLKTNLLVILNDNEMSISPNVGALSKYLSRILSGSFYSSMREGSKKFLQSIPSAWEIARRTEEHVKGMMVPGTLFEELGFAYFGPIDGHDIDSMLSILRNLKKLNGPRLLHIVTKKGMGYAPAESDSCKFHGVSPFDISTGKMNSKGSAQVSFTNVFSDWIVQKGKSDKRCHAITPAMREGSGLVEFSSLLPAQYHDVAIAEQHAVTLAAGLSISGLKPVVAIYSTFLQRAYDQVIHDVAIQNLDILFAIDRAGIVGADGATHTGNFDISYLRCIPGSIIMTPSNGEELWKCLNSGYVFQGPAFVRYPRDNTESTGNRNDETFPVGESKLCRSGKQIAVLVFGTLLGAAHKVANNLNTTLVDMRFVQPLDETRLKEIFSSHDKVVTVEDNSVKGGAGSAVLEWMQNNRIYKPCLTLGLPHTFPDQGNRQDILEKYGLDAHGLQKSIENFINEPASFT